LEDDFLLDVQLLEAFKKVEFFACHSTNDTATARQADILFGAAAWTEREGVFVNFQGWAQRLHPAVTTKYLVRGLDHLHMSRLDRFGAPNDSWARGHKRDARESWKITQMIASYLGDNWHYKHTEDVFEDVAEHVSQFSGMDYDKLGEYGLPIAGDTKEVKHPLYREVYQELTSEVESIGSVMLS
jgi:formate dehydrogenase major subunit